VLMFLFVLGSVMVLSVGTARRTLALVAAGAAATVQVDRARRKLAEIVRGHHDARSVIAAAQLSSDMMVRALHDGNTRSLPESDVQRQAERLRQDLESARKQLGELGEKAYLELATLGEVERVETRRVLSDAVDVLRLRFPELEIEAELPRGDAPAADMLVVGGASSIQRILYNLVSNAREGDGRSGASHVTVRVRSEGALVPLVVEDDGPGFEPSALSGVSVVPASTKPNGMGLGLLMTSELVRVSGGSFSAENRPGGGARLSLTLPAAGSEPRR